jgi:DNA-binding response OmpR family regulator
MDTDEETIVVVEDEPNIADLLDLYLRRAGYRVVLAPDGDAALASVERHRPRLVVLDIGLPGALDGLEVCRRIRSGDAGAASEDVPIVFLTARDDEVDRIVGLELGADDYVTKPFSPRELAARVRTVLRRTRAPAAAPQRLEFGAVELDGSAREVRRAGAEVRLTAKEFDLLWLLASHPRRVFARDQLMSLVWGYEPALDSGTVTVHVRRLRQKLEDDPARPRHLQTVWGVGYRLAP